MAIIKNKINKEIECVLLNGGVGVLATDTIYGLVGSALSKKTIKRIYQLRQRNLKKPLIILISSLFDLKLFNIRISDKTKKQLLEFWPGKVSVILPCVGKKFAYLHRGIKSLAFRLPAKKSLANLIKKVGPLAGPSANLEGKPTARTIAEAKKYFNDKIDFYINSGKIAGSPSALIKIKNNKIIVIRS